MALITCQIEGNFLNATRMEWLSDEDTDDLAVRRELAAASVASIGDFWDDEVDAEWQDFAPEVG